VKGSTWSERSALPGKGTFGPTPTGKKEPSVKTSGNHKRNYMGERDNNKRGPVTPGFFFRKERGKVLHSIRLKKSLLFNRREAGSKKKELFLPSDERKRDGRPIKKNEAS